MENLTIVFMQSGLNYSLQTIIFSTLFDIEDSKIQNLMKSVFIFFSLLICSISFGQAYSIPQVDYPFFDAVEWKGNGLMLMSRDPSGLKKKITLTYLSDKNYSVWQESFNPSSKDYFYISGENARYVYFLDHLEPVEGKISFHQISSAGNIKSSVAQISAALRKIGSFESSQLKMIDIITTDKALLFILRHQDKKEKKYTDLLVSMTHHNMVTYAGIIGDITEAQLKDPRYSYWNYCGFEGENIFFYTKDVSDKKSGWSIQTISSKTEKVETRFIEGPGVNFDMTPFSSFGMTGGFYLKSNEHSGPVLSYMNSKFYLLGMKTEGTSKTAELYLLSEAKWKKINAYSLPVENSKKPITYSSITLKEGLVLANGSSNIFLSFEGEKLNKKGTSNNFTPNNPSRSIINDPKAGIALSLPTGILLFDPAQLNKPGNVNLEFIKK